MNINIISGEKIQEIANIYLGINNDINNNSYFYNQTNKYKNMLDINSNYDNPKIVFCYGYQINILSDKLKYFTNDFILITHNSDKNMIDNDTYIKNIYNCSKLLKWFSQNLCFEHSKLFLLPIGIANNQWKHGSSFHIYYNTLTNTLTNTSNTIQENKKSKSIYFFFEISTNKEKRQNCYNSVIKKIQFLNKISEYENFKRLSEYEFCICPEGNGVDTHRFWEALYLKCIPIVVNSQFIDIIKKNINVPMIILNSWDELDINNLQEYNTFDFTDNEKYLNLDYYLDKIKE